MSAPIDPVAEGLFDEELRRVISHAEKVAARLYEGGSSEGAGALRMFARALGEGVHRRPVPESERVALAARVLGPGALGMSPGTKLVTGR